VNLFPVFQTILYTLSTALLYPVVILLILLCLWLMVYTGGFLAEYVKRCRLRSNGNLADAMEEMNRQRQLTPEIGANLPMHLNRYAAELAAIIQLKGSEPGTTCKPRRTALKKSPCSTGTTRPVNRISAGAT